MVNTVRLAIFLSMALMVTLSKAEAGDYNGYPEKEKITDEELAELAPFIANQEYIRQIYSIMNGHKDVLGSRMMVETNALIDTKYKTWKRNADLINSILALPKGMNDAGR